MGINNFAGEDKGGNFVKEYRYITTMNWIYYLSSRYSASVSFTPSKRYCSSSMSSLKRIWIIEEKTGKEKKNIKVDIICNL